MLERVKFFVVHSALHVLLYSIPRFLHKLLVRLPTTLWELLTGKRPLTYGWRKDRHIHVVMTKKDDGARQRLQRLFGLHDNMVYKDPMYNGHMQTLLGAARPARRVSYDRELVPGDDKNPICLDWLKPTCGPEKAKGIILMVPGVGNYSQTPYAQRFARAAVKRDFYCCVLTPRGMGSAPLTQPQLTCLTFTMDVRTVLRDRLQPAMIEKEFGRRLPIHAVGYSAGGITLIKAVVEEERAAAAQGPVPRYPDGFPLTTCCSMMSPYEMVASAASMQSWIGLKLYQSAMMTALRKYSLKHRAVFANGIPGLPEMESPEELRAYISSLKTVQDFDEHVVAPHFGYEGARGYYADGFSFKWLPHIKGVDVVCVGAVDDPIAGHGLSIEDWQQMSDKQPRVAYVETPTGGHFGHLRGPFGEWKGTNSFLYDFPLDMIETYIAESA